MKLYSLNLAGLKCFLLLLLMSAYPVLTGAQELFLNEVMASNDSVISDEDGDFQDWIEIYYNGNEPLNLTEFGLSDDKDEPYKWTFPDIIIQPGEFLLIWASNKERNTPNEQLHTNFAISASGEEVILTHANGTLLDQLTPTEIPSDISIGRQPDGTGSWGFFNNPTPGQSNDTESTSGQLGPPELSHTPGFYTSDFNLEISHTEDNVTIYYTLDGSAPAEDSPTYSDPIPIYNQSDEPNGISTILTNHATAWFRSQNPKDKVRKGTVVRIKAEKNGYLPAFTAGTYFVFKNGITTHNLPVVSLSTDNQNLFSEETGIYVPGNLYEEGEDNTGNYYQRGDEWEREASLEFFEEDGHRGFSQNVGIRIHGGWTRRLPQKSLRIYARSEYGESRINYPIFPDQKYDSYDRLILRNSGNDWGFTLMRDAAAQLIVQHFNMDTQAHRPAAVYINGEYWGLHNIRERYDSHYLERVYGINRDNIDYLSGRWTAEEGDNSEYGRLLNFIENQDLSLSSSMNHIRKKIDLDNYLDYYTAQIYFANVDWPQNNVEFWRLSVPYSESAPTGHDGRWRWMPYDLDQSFGAMIGTAGIEPEESFDMIEWVLAEKNPVNNQQWPGLIFRKLLQNQSFKNDFINRVADHLNTSFQPERMTAIVDSLKGLIEMEMENHFERWIYPKSYKAWESNLDAMYSFIEARPDYLIGHIMEHFGIESTTTITVDSSHPSNNYVKVNSLEIYSETTGLPSNPFPWSGTYFSGIPIQLKAEIAGENRFSYWLINNTKVYDPEIAILPDTVETARAVFEERLMSEIISHSLTEGDYHFSDWNKDQSAASYPASMGFVYMNEPEPGLEAKVAGLTFGSYNLDSRTRINGLGEDGFSFINTGNEEGNPGYPGTRLGAALLILNTEDRDSVSVEWTAGTVEPNSRIYNIRLQYRTVPDEAFRDVLDEKDNPVEYKRNEMEGHSETIGPIVLPQEAKDKERVELLWRYYYTGDRVDEESGQRSMLNISDIHITSKVQSEKPTTDQIRLYQNYPNPFYPITEIEYDIPSDQNVRIDLYSIDGRHITTLEDRLAESGHHYIEVDVSGLASGIYLYRMVADDFSEIKKMSVVK